MKKKQLWIMILGAIIFGFAGCGGGSSNNDSSSSSSATATPIVIDDNDGADYDPISNLPTFVSTINNPYFTLTAGKTWKLEGVDEDNEKETVIDQVTTETKTILGIPMTVVHAQEFDEDGELVEDTKDWYAQDVDGNVWYFGEDTAEYDDGKLETTAGSWEAGVNGAQPGIIMKANPQVGDVYRQEYLKGEAEDMGEVLEVGISITIGLGTYEECIKIKDWTPLEPSVEEHKYFCKEVGTVVLEKKVAGDAGQVELVEIQ